MQDSSAASTGKKLPLRLKLGYSVGQLSDSVGYNVFYFFFLFFLTDIAGIGPGTAGTIVAIAIAWDALTDPIVGSISDNLNSRWGRRRPMMIASLVPYCLFLYLLFTIVGEGTSRAVYFCIVAVLFWSSYKIFVIPFFALGAELTDDFNERTSLRVWASVCLYGAVMIASATPTMIAEISIENFGLTPVQGWNNVGLIFALLTAVTISVCWYFTRGGEATRTATEVAAVPGEKGSFFKHFFSDVKSVLGIGSARILSLSVLTWSAMCSLGSSGLVYLMMNNMGFGNADVSFFFTMYCLMAVAWLPILQKLSDRFDKRQVYYMCMGISGIAIVFFYFIGFSGLGILLVFGAMVQIGNCTFWTLYYSMMYDISELDEYKSGKRREGSIAAIMSLSQKIGAACGLWILGFALEMGGYDGTAEVQPQSAHDMILTANTLIAGVMALAAAVFGYMYPLTRKRFEALLQALYLKRENKPHSQDGFKELL